jgi:hypothetical protein
LGNEIRANLIKKLTNVVVELRMFNYKSGEEARKDHPQVPCTLQEDFMITRKLPAHGRKIL